MRCSVARWRIGLLGVLAALTAGAARGQGVDFERQIRPILQQHCVKCHGADKQEGGLRLDHRAAGLRGGDNYAPAIKPKQAADSPLFQFIARTDADLVMPPKGPRLSDAQIELVRRWIDEGAPWPDEPQPLADKSARHWSFQPLRRPAVPVVATESDRDAELAAGLSPLDAFIGQQLRSAHLTPAPAAERRTLIRRLYLVMLGLPPTPDEVERFVHDPADDAWHRLVDSVLANPRYGERWAQFWLDLVRFGETNGFETNRERPTAWHFRDFVIQALNADLPYNEFVRQQIAGDATGDDVATGFLVAGPYDLVKSQDINLTLMQRQDELADMINTTGTAVLGLTVGCARCHNHKFDPITQRDYYALQAIFAGVQHGERALPVPPARSQALAVLDRRIADLTQRLVPFIRPATRGLILVDDAALAQDAGRGVQVLAPPRGVGTNPAGTSPGFAQDPGSATRGANASGGQYSWWDNQPGADVLAYRPRAQGRFRLWISWGAGFETHSPNAQFVLDADGDPGTTSDQRVLATVDQRQLVGASGPLANQPLWSGFQSVGIHDLSPSAAILVRGGREGSALTADVLALEAVAADVVDRVPPTRLALREPVRSERNVEQLEPTPARFVRFTILATNSSEPCLDELAIFAGETNVALASRGTQARCSSALPGYDIHKLQHVNDGQYGNSHSWISNEPGRGWVELELPAVATIDRIEWGRDAEGKFRDRVAVRYRIEVAVEPDRWRTVASSDDRLPPSDMTNAGQAPDYQFDRFPPRQADEGRGWLRELTAARQQRQDLANTDRAYLGTFQTPPTTHRLFRGDPLAPREEVGPDTIAVLGKLGLPPTAAERERRVALARFLSDDANPLTARVWVNRIWQFQFGRGLVDTPNDFGANGVPPTHPELLDWLAAELIASGWSTKHIQRLILLSQTWQQDSRPTSRGLAADAACRLWWRYPPRRLEAEAIRDSVLAATGALDLRAGGPGFDGFEVQLENVRHYFPKKTFGPADWRRMVYMTKVRMEKEATFGVFDCPDASQAVARRSQSTTPLQALNLLNSDFIQLQSRLLAQRLRREAGDDAASQVRRAVTLMFGRPAETAELQEGGQFIAAEGLEAYCRAMLNANEFLFIP